ncbi:hypothetical protein MNBD_ALPHA06-258, partial [hydrothermal vent metagenome]
MTEKPAKQPISPRQAAPKTEESPLQHLANMRHDPDAIREAFENGVYPYKTKVKR